MKAEIVAESVYRHDDGRNAVVTADANTIRVTKSIEQKVTHALILDAN